ncbi:MAG: C39 family peptidase [Kiritimatiellia bacterium]
MNILLRTFPPLLLALLTLGARAAPEPDRLADIPHVKQKPDFCGEACVEMWLRKLGYATTQDEVFNRSGLDPLEGRGCYTRELVQACETIGFKVDRKTTFTRIRAKAPGPDLEKAFAALVADLQAGTPSIVCTHFDKNPGTTEHFRLVTGFDEAAGEVVYNDPALEDGRGLRMKKADFLELWPLKYDAAVWTVVRIPLAPGRMTVKKDAPAATGKLTAADYAQHIRKLRGTIDLKPYTVLIEPPFVVVGNLDSADLRIFSQKTVRWAVTLLRKAYFEKEPDRVLTIWLLKDAPSYEALAKAVAGDPPDTPYGFYSSTADALIMNIATGGGTLVHEIVHPFVEANIPDCPPWFNEGLGSLYEQCEDRAGRIAGLTNWRLAGLQKEIRGKSLPDFKTLCGYDSRGFYRGVTGDNYAQARYLLYYLQEEGKLDAFYRRFMKTRKDDPSGYQALVDTLGNPDMGKFQAAWEAYVLKLRFGR